MALVLLRRGAAPPAEVAGPAMLRRAQGLLQKWPEGFRGFRATLECGMGSRSVAGCALVSPDACMVDVGDAELGDTARAVLTRMARERVPRFFKDGDGRFPMSVHAEDSGSVEIVVHDPALDRLAYRIDAVGLLRDICRVSNGIGRTVSHETYQRASPGRILPARRVLRREDVAQGRVLSERTVTEGHRVVDHVWLPEHCHVEPSHGAAFWLRLSRHDPL